LDWGLLAGKFISTASESEIGVGIEMSANAQYNGISYLNALLTKAYEQNMLYES